MYNTMQAESRKLESLIFRADGEWEGDPEETAEIIAIYWAMEF